VLFYSGIDLGFNREQQKQFAESDIINSELRIAFGDSRRADEHPVLTAGDRWSAAISLMSLANKKCGSESVILPGCSTCPIRRVA
jgi:hypothetical protein